MVIDEITEELGALTERVAALGIGKATLTACVRVPHEDKPAARRQEVRTYAILTRARSADLRRLTAGEVWLRIRTDGTFGAVRGKNPQLRRSVFGPPGRGASCGPASPGPAYWRRHTCGACPAGHERLSVADRFAAVRNASTTAAIGSASRTRSRWPP